MEFNEVIKKRYSCRNYLDQEIPTEILDKILTNAILAPSAKNIQPWHFYIVTNPQLKEELQIAAKNQKFVSQAAAIVVATGINSGYTMTCGFQPHVLDVALALENITLSATEQGIGSCFIGAFYQDKVKELLHLPKEEEVIEMLTLGYPADQQKQRPLKDFSEMVTYLK